MSNLSRSQKSHEEILDAAWTLISRRGADISIAEIAQAVGMTRQSIYVHFGSRGGLLIALVRRTDARERIFENFAEALKEPDALKRLNSCLNVWLNFVTVIHPVARDLIRLKSRDTDARNAWEDRMRDAHNLFEQLVTTFADEQVLKPCWTIQQAADYLWANCSVQTWELLIVERGWSHDQAAENICRSMAQVLLK